MSAFLVGNRHVDVILSAALGVTYVPSWEGERIDSGRGYDQAPGRDRGVTVLDVIGQALLEENAASVAYRYSEQAEPISYKFQHVAGMRDNPLDAIKAIGCLCYQSCEHPGWETSEAKRFLEATRDALVWSLPGLDEAEGWPIRDDYTAA